MIVGTFTLEQRLFIRLRAKFIINLLHSASGRTTYWPRYIFWWGLWLVNSQIRLLGTIWKIISKTLDKSTLKYKILNRVKLGKCKCNIKKKNSFSNLWLHFSDFKVSCLQKLVSINVKIFLSLSLTSWKIILGKSIRKQIKAGKS